MHVCISQHITIKYANTTQTNSSKYCEVRPVVKNTSATFINLWLYCSFLSFQRVIFNVVNFSKTKSLYRDGMSPVVKSTSRPKW